jgi:glutaredoxin-related protein
MTGPGNERLVLLIRRERYCAQRKFRRTTKVMKTLETINYNYPYYYNILRSQVIRVTNYNGTKKPTISQICVLLQTQELLIQIFSAPNDSSGRRIIQQVIQQIINCSTLSRRAAYSEQIYEILLHTGPVTQEKRLTRLTHNTQSTIRSTYQSKSTSLRLLTNTQLRESSAGFVSTKPSFPQIQLPSQTLNFCQMLIFHQL